MVLAALSPVFIPRDRSLRRRFYEKKASRPTGMYEILIHASDKAASRIHASYLGASMLTNI